MKERVLSLDALRGFAIITMILSGQILLTYLPAWMAHAQMPPKMGFTPSVLGITWVDLVFPFFLFSMGAAFPFSLGSKLSKGASKISVSVSTLVRGAQLLFFAIFFQHMRPHIISGDASSFSANLISLLSFVLMFFMFMDINIPKLKDTKYAAWSRWGIKLLAYTLAFVLMNTVSFEGGKTQGFNQYFSDIILVVLANMAVFGGIIYVLTWKKPLYRLGVLPFVMAIFLSGINEGWVKALYDYTPLAWAYKFYYLKYLFIVIPGTIAGEYLYEWTKSKVEFSKTEKSNKQAGFMLIASLSLIVSNVIFLYTRELVLNLAITILLIGLMNYLMKMEANKFSSLWKRLFAAGSYLLVLGLFFEAYEGGIRKDPSTYSYYFVTSGLAFFALIVLSVVCDYFKQAKAMSFLVKTGQNPMIAYATTSMLVMPILTIAGVTQYFDVFHNGAFMGLLRGIVLTALAVLVTMFFTNKKWFWRT